MNYKSFGRTGIRVSEIIFGTVLCRMTMGSIENIFLMQ